jgi:SAM-dependent methyltransferase
MSGNYELYSGWLTDEYYQEKKKNFDNLSKYLQSPPLRILDIGCGLAWESRMFSDAYNTELWLLDGDSSTNESKESAGYFNYHASANTFGFYNSMSFLKEELDKRNTKNYHLIDANNIDIPNTIKFDVITSWLSCGFHYPVSTYRDLILKHSHENTKVIVDLRCHIKTKEIILEDSVEIISIIDRYKKYATAEIKFK